MSTNAYSYPVVNSSNDATLAAAAAGASMDASEASFRADYAERLRQSFNSILQEISTLASASARSTSDSVAQTHALGVKIEEFNSICDEIYQLLEYSKAQLTQKTLLKSASSAVPAVVSASSSSVSSSASVGMFAASDAAMQPPVAIDAAALKSELDALYQLWSSQ